MINKFKNNLFIEAKILLLIILILGIVFISGCTEKPISTEPSTKIITTYNPPPNVTITPVTFTEDGLCHNEEYSTHRVFSGDIVLTVDSYTKLETNIKKFSDALWGISNLVCLEFFGLDLFDNQVSDIRALSGLTNLRSLNLLKTKVIDASPLSGLKKLENLYLTKTPISDVSPLRHLTNLKLISLAETKVSSSDCNSLKQYLVNTEILCADFDYFS